MSVLLSQTSSRPLYRRLLVEMGLSLRIAKQADKELDDTTRSILIKKIVSIKSEIASFHYSEAVLITQTIKEIIDTNEKSASSTLIRIKAVLPSLIKELYRVQETRQRVDAENKALYWGAT